MAQFDLLQKRPELFSVSGARTEGIREAVVQRLADGLETATQNSQRGPGPVQDIAQPATDHIKIQPV